MRKNILLLLITIGFFIPGLIFSAPQARLQHDKAIANYVKSLVAKADLFVKANQYADACQILSEAIFFDPCNTKAGKLREMCARKIAKQETDKTKEVKEQSLEKCDKKIQKAILTNFPKVVDEAIRQQRYTDAAYWIRFICSRVDFFSAEKSASMKFKTALGKLRRSFKKLAKAKAYWQILLVGEKLRSPNNDNKANEEIDKFIATAEETTQEEKGVRDKEIETAKNGHIKREAGEFLYWMSLPEEYELEGNSAPYPVVVSVTGSGAQYEQEIMGWTNRFRARGFIFIAPVTTSNTRKEMYQKYYPDFSGDSIAFDHAGITRLLEDLESLFGADRERFFITGLSGGGTYAYFATMHDLGRWRGTAPRNPNFYPSKFPGGSSHQSAKGEIYMPVHIFTAEKDEHKLTIGGRTPGVEPQTKEACAALNKARFACVLRTEVPDVTHNESFKYFDQILDWFDKVVAGTQVSGEPPDYWPKKKSKK